MNHSLKDLFFSLVVWQDFANESAIKWVSFLVISYSFVFIFSGVHNWVEGFRKGTNFPLAEDLNGAAQALVRLQDTYQLDMPSLAHGYVLPSNNQQQESAGVEYNEHGRS